MQFVLVFLVLFLTIAINLPADMIRGIGVDPKYLMAALGAWVLAGMLKHTQIFLVVLVVGIALMANLPAESLKNMNIDRDYLLIALILVAVAPVIAKK